MITNDDDVPRLLRVGGAYHALPPHCRESRDRLEDCFTLHEEGPNSYEKMKIAIALLPFASATRSLYHITGTGMIAIAIVA
jgi:hypothetical protein